MAEAIDEAMETENSPVEGATEAQVTTNTRRGTRLIITKIVNENFKSYAGVVELGPFHKASLLNLTNRQILLTNLTCFFTISEIFLDCWT